MPSDAALVMATSNTVLLSVPFVSPTCRFAFLPVRKQSRSCHEFLRTLHVLLLPGHTQCRCATVFRLCFEAGKRGGEHAHRLFQGMVLFQDFLYRYWSRTLGCRCGRCRQFLSSRVVRLLGAHGSAISAGDAHSMSRRNKPEICNCSFCLAIVICRRGFPSGSKPKVPGRGVVCVCVFRVPMGVQPLCGRLPQQACRAFSLPRLSGISRRRDQGELGAALLTAKPKYRQSMSVLVGCRSLGSLRSAPISRARRLRYAVSSIAVA